MSKYYVLIPAAGQGVRMGNEMPKQYLPLLGKPMLLHSVDLFLSCSIVDKIFLILSPDDDSFHKYLQRNESLKSKLQLLYCGGATRAESVHNGLKEMNQFVYPQDWVLVHDAARPCLSIKDLNLIIAALSEDDVGGLLAVPVADTLKKSNSENKIIATENRVGLWQAQTPQMFRYGILYQALSACDVRTPTDEAQAVEWLGLKPKLVKGSTTNFKVTYPEDIQLAELILKLRIEKDT